MTYQVTMSNRSDSRMCDATGHAGSGELSKLPRMASVAAFLQLA